jgi:hypothetical protein
MVFLLFFFAFAHRARAARRILREIRAQPEFDGEQLSIQ